MLFWSGKRPKTTLCPSLVSSLEVKLKHDTEVDARAFQASGNALSMKTEISSLSWKLNSYAPNRHALPAETIKMLDTANDSIFKVVHANPYKSFVVAIQQWEKRNQFNEDGER